MKAGGMLPAGTIDDFLRHPIGRYVSGGSYVVWVHSPTLIGNVYFGRPDERDLADHRRMFDLPAHRDLAPPFDVVLDASLLERADLSCYETLADYVVNKLPRFVSLVHRMAVIPPDKLIGAIIIGTFHQIVAPRFQARLCADRAAAFQWLDRADGGDARAELDATIETVCGAPTVVRRVRACLAAEPSLRMDTVASSLAMSERTLQRELATAGTSFRTEIARARLRQAEMLLRDTGLKLEVIARRLGYSSLAHFSAQFRRLRGVSPTDYRRQTR